MAADMKISAIAPWFGSKRTLAPRIVSYLGEHRCYWEPFCGSMAVLLSKPEVTTETVCDLHGDLVNLATTIQDAIEGPRLYRRLRRVWMIDEQHEKAAECMRNPFEPTPDRAFWYFVWSWQGRNGVSGTGGYNVSFARRFTPNGGQGGKRFQSAVASIPAWRRRLANVNIWRTDAFSVLPKIDDVEGVAIYCDPPYLVKGASYIHDFATADHQRLAQALGRFRKARVVVSYYEHPDLADLYPGWQKIDCTMTKALVNQGMRDANGEAAKAPEVLLINTRERLLFA